MFLFEGTRNSRENKKHFSRFPSTTVYSEGYKIPMPDATSSTFLYYLHFFNATIHSLSGSAARWYRIRSLITSKSCLSDESTLVRFEPAFHITKLTIVLKCNGVKIIPCKFAHKYIHRRLHSSSFVFFSDRLRHIPLISKNEDLFIPFLSFGVGDGNGREIPACL